MATTANITTSYAGEDTKKWVSAALLKGNTLANNLIRYTKPSTIKANIVPANICKENFICSSLFPRFLFSIIKIFENP